MSEEPGGIEELISRISNIYEKLRAKVVDWWWLEQGEVPLISVTAISVEGKRARLEQTPKLSLTAALKRIRDSLAEVKNLRGEDRLIALHSLVRDLFEVKEIVRRVVEADRIVTELERVLNAARRKLGGRAKEVEGRAYEMISEIKETFLQDPRGWDEKKINFERTLGDLKSSVSGLELKMEGEGVIEEEKEELLEEA